MSRRNTEPERAARRKAERIRREELAAEREAAMRRGLEEFAARVDAGFYSPDYQMFRVFPREGELYGHAGQRRTSLR